MNPDSFEREGHSDFERALLQAKTEPEIFGAVARLVWASGHCTLCPDEMVPSERDLHAWWGTVPAEVMFEADRRLNAVLAEADDYPHNVTHWDIVEEFCWGKHRLTGWQFPILAAVQFWTGPGSGSASIRILTLPHVHAEWLENAKDRHPLAPLVNAWQRRPKEVKAERRPGRILPSKLAHVPPSDRRALRLFSPAAHSPDDQQVLPGFGDRGEPAAPSLPLALYDLGVGVGQTAGKGAAPLGLRLFVESVLAVPAVESRHGDPVVFALTLRELLERIWPYPNGRLPSPAHYWPQLMRAVEALEAPEARVPWYDLDTGQGGLRRVVSFGDIPRGPGHLDDVVRVIVDLPPGSHVGPMVGPSLGYWGMKSAPAYRLYLNLAYRLFEPGRTHVPVGKGSRRHWVLVNDPKRFERLSDDELVRLAFPTSVNRSVRNLRPRARAALEALVKLGDFRIVEGRIMPPKGGVGVEE